MTEKWEKKKLKDVCEYKKIPCKKTGLPYVGLEDIEGHTGRFIGSLQPKRVKSNTFHFTNKHILYGRLRPYLNKVLCPTFEGHCSTEIFPILPKENILKEYLFHWLMYEETTNRINATWTGARMPRANMNEVLGFAFLIPSISEQKRIVSILDEVVAGIDKAKENAEKNLANAKELFESYLHRVFDNPGEAWEVKTFGNVCKFIRGPFGGSLKKSCFKSSGIAVYEQQHAINNQFDSIRYFIDEAKFNEMKRFEVTPGELIMSCSGTMGKVAIVPETVQKGIINQALLKLTPNNTINAIYLKLWMESQHFIEQLAKHTKGAAIKNVASVKILKEIDVPVPPPQGQRQLIGVLKQFANKTQKLEAIYQQKLKDLEELKKSILQKAFNGELKG